MIGVAPFVAISARENSISGRSRNEFKGVEMTDQKPKMIYNNPRFPVKQYDFDLFAGPAAGEKFKDFVKAGLQMAIRHKQVDGHYKKYGKFRNQVDAPPLDASVEQNDEKPFAAAE